MIVPGCQLTNPYLFWFKICHARTSPFLGMRVSHAATALKWVAFEPRAMPCLGDLRLFFQGFCFGILVRRAHAGEAALTPSGRSARPTGT